MTRKGIIEFEDIWNRRVTVRYNSIFVKCVYLLQLWILRRKKVIKNVWFHNLPEEVFKKDNV